MAWTAPKVDWDAVDAVIDSDLNEMGNNLVWLKEYTDLTTAGVHGSATAATANTIIHRDADGRAKVVAPAVAGDIAILSTVTDHSTDTANPHSTTKAHVGLGSVTDNAQMPIAGGTFTGKAYAVNPDTSYTTAQVRNIKLLTSVPGAGDLENGEVAFVYEV